MTNDELIARAEAALEDIQSIDTVRHLSRALAHIRRYGPALIAALKASEARNNELREVSNQWRLAASGMVSVQSAIDLHDKTFAALKGGAE